MTKKESRCSHKEAASVNSQGKKKKKKKKRMRPSCVGQFPFSET